jgi:hypothetical protein
MPSYNRLRTYLFNVQNIVSLHARLKRRNYSSLYRRNDWLRYRSRLYEMAEIFLYQQGKFFRGQCWLHGPFCAPYTLRHIKF